MRREGSRVGKNIIGGQGRCKKGRVKFIMAQESGGAKGKQRGGKGQGYMMGGSRGRGARGKLGLTLFMGSPGDFSNV